MHELESVARQVRARSRRERESEAAGSSSQPRLEMFMVRTRVSVFYSQRPGAHCSQKTEDALRISNNLRWPSDAFSLRACPGRAYVLAPSHADVYKALQGLPSLVGAPIVHVEAEDQYQVNKLLRGLAPSSLELAVGDWVRMRLGKHQGRLARVRQVSEDSDIVTVAIAPLLPVGRKNTLV